MLEYIILPDSLKELSDGIFYRCTKLKYFPKVSQLKVIGDKAFAYTSVITVELQETIEVLYGEVFKGCYKLKSISIKETTRANIKGFYYLRLNNVKIEYRP
jgi:hypothetical protein